MSEMQPSRQSQYEIDALLHNIPDMIYGKDFTVKQLVRFKHGKKQRWTVTKK